MNLRLVGMVLICAIGMFCGSSQAFADGETSKFGKRAVNVHGTEEGRAVFTFPPVEGVADVYIYSYDLACAPGEPNMIDESTCHRMNSTCRAEPDGRLVQWERLDTRTPGAAWERLGSSCMYNGKPPERPGDIVIAVTERQLRELPIAAPTVGSQPGRHTLKGAETNIYAESADQTFTIDILGRRVDVRVKPSEFQWDYGDGSTLVTSFPGGLIPESRWGEKTVTSHVYGQTGDFAVNLTTVFTGEFSVDGGPHQPIVGSAPIPSAPRTLSVWRSEVKLYADDCNVNPQGAGCQ